MLITLMVLCMTACGTKVVRDDYDDEDEDEQDVEDLTEVVCEKPDIELELGEPQKFTVNEHKLTAETNGLTIELSPTMVTANTKMTVTEATKVPWMVNENDQVRAVKLTVGKMKEFKGVAKIGFPVVRGSGQVLVAGRYNESAGEWESAECYHDASAGKAVITTDKPGIYGMAVISDAMAKADDSSSDPTFGWFFVAKQNTRAAGLVPNRYPYVTYDDPPMTVIHAILNNLLGDNTSPLMNEGDLVANQLLEEKAIFADITYPLLKEAGLGKKFLDNTANLMGKLSVAALFYQKARARTLGKNKQADDMLLKHLSDWFTKQGSNLCKSSAMNLCMVSVAIIDYVINKFATEAWTGRTDLYRKAYRRYYSEGEQGYMSDEQWFDQFWPEFTKEGQTEHFLNIAIDNFVWEYCRRFWKDETVIAAYLEEVGLYSTGGGGYNDQMREELTAEMRGELYSKPYRLPAVFQSIGDKMRQKQYDLMKDRMVKYANNMNELVTLKIKDKAAKKGKSAYAGYTVKFKGLPISIQDPEKWECTLDERGEGQIKFRLFAYAVAKVKPVLVIKKPGKKGKVVKEVPIGDIQPGINNVTFSAGQEDKEEKEEEAATANVRPFRTTFSFDIKALKTITADGSTTSDTEPVSMHDDWGFANIEGREPNITTTVSGSTLKVKCISEKEGYKESLSYDILDFTDVASSLSRIKQMKVANVIYNSHSVYEDYSGKKTTDRTFKVDGVLSFTTNDSYEGLKNYHFSLSGVNGLNLNLAYKITKEDTDGKVTVTEYKYVPADFNSVGISFEFYQIK